MREYKTVFLLIKTNFKLYFWPLEGHLSASTTPPFSFCYRCPHPPWSVGGLVSSWWVFSQSKEISPVTCHIKVLTLSNTVEQKCSTHQPTGRLTAWMTTLSPGILICHHSKHAVNEIHLPIKKHPKLFLDHWDGLVLPLGIPVASVFGPVLQFLQQWMAAPQDGPCPHWHQVEIAPHLPARAKGMEKPTLPWT